MNKKTTRDRMALAFTLSAVAAFVLLLLMQLPAARGVDTPEATVAVQPADNREGLIRVGRMIYAGGQTSKCFAEGFLDMADRNMDSNIARTLEGVQLNSEQIYEFPFIIMTGPEKFTLSEEERQHLKTYLERGGFLLASAGCSNAGWNRSFRKVIEEIFPNAPLEELDTRHPIFHQLVDVERIIPSKGSAKGAIYGLTIDGRLAMVYSPLGLNDSSNAGAGCCCCGGNEVRNAKDINANILSYALTH